MGLFRNKGGHKPPEKSEMPISPPPDPVPPPSKPEPGQFKSGLPSADQKLRDDGWRMGHDGLWRNDRFGGSFRADNALKRIGSVHGEEVDEWYPSKHAFEDEPRLVSIRDISINYARERHGEAAACVIRHYPSDCEVVAFRDGRRNVHSSTLCDEAMEKINRAVAESGWFDREER